MPPKKKTTQKVDQSPNSDSSDGLASELPSFEAFQEILDSRLKVQEEKLKTQMKEIFKDVLTYKKNSRRASIH